MELLVLPPGEDFDQLPVLGLQLRPTRAVGRELVDSVLLDEASE
jgi:hypothetical protein